MRIVSQGDTKILIHADEHGDGPIVGIGERVFRHNNVFVGRFAGIRDNSCVLISENTDDEPVLYPFEKVGDWRHALHSYHLSRETVERIILVEMGWKPEDADAFIACAEMASARAGHVPHPSDVPF